MATTEATIRRKISERKHTRATSPSFEKECKYPKKFLMKPASN